MIGKAVNYNTGLEGVSYRTKVDDRKERQLLSNLYICVRLLL